MSGFRVKIRWRLGALPPDPLSLRRLGASPPDPRLWLPLPNPEWVSLISLLFLVSCCVNLSPSLFFSKPRFISNLNETPKFTVISIICAKFGMKAGAQNSFLPPGAGYPSYATDRQQFFLQDTNAPHSSGFQLF